MIIKYKPLEPVEINFIDGNMICSLGNLNYTIKNIGSIQEFKSLNPDWIDRIKKIQKDLYIAKIGDGQ